MNHKYQLNKLTSRYYSDPYINIYKSELRFITGQALKAGTKETGGSLYGLFTHGQRPIIMLATPPGPNAIHETAHFQPDIVYLRNTNRFLWDTFGIQCIGDEHSHHSLSLCEVSRGDVYSTNSIASKNNFNFYCQLILNFKNHFPENTLQGRYFLKFKKVFVKVNAFFYPEAGTGAPIRCPIRVIPGVSPIRKALRKNRDIFYLGKNPYLAMSRIKYEGLYDSRLLENISKQISALPKYTQTDIKVMKDNETIIASINLGVNDANLIVTFNSQAPYEILSVFMSFPEQDDPVDISVRVLKQECHPSLRTVFLKSSALIHKYKTGKVQRNHYIGEKLLLLPERCKSLLPSKFIRKRNI